MTNSTKWAIAGVGLFVVIVGIATAVSSLSNELGRVHNSKQGSIGELMDIFASGRVDVQNELPIHAALRKALGAERARGASVEAQ